MDSLITGCQQPKSPNYVTLQSRIKTFNSWPPNSCQNPITLAEAGFVYTGHKDKVRCFHCDGGLKGWSPEDNPFSEHIEWYPKCYFIRVYKQHNEKSESAINQCKVCLENKLTLTCIPCGHFCLCHSCAANLYICPLCRTKITAVIKTYM